MVTEGVLPPELPVFGWELPHNVNLWYKTLKSIHYQEANNIGMYARDWMRKHWSKWSDFGEQMGERITECHHRWQMERF